MYFCAFSSIPKIFHSWHSNNMTHLPIYIQYHWVMSRRTRVGKCTSAHTVIWPSPFVTTIRCAWMSRNCALYFVEWQWLCIDCAFTVKQALSSIVDSCRSDHRAAPPKPRKVWITLSRRSKLAQWVVILGTHTHSHTQKSVVVTQAWITGQCMFHTVCHQYDRCVKQWCSLKLTLTGWGRIEWYLDILIVITQEQYLNLNVRKEKFKDAGVRKSFKTIQSQKC